MLTALVLGVFSPSAKDFGVSRFENGDGWYFALTMKGPTAVDVPPNTFTMFFTTGGHRDYHQVTDEPQYLDFDQYLRVTRFIRDVAVRVADLDHRPVVDKPKPDPNGACTQ